MYVPKHSIVLIYERIRNEFIAFSNILLGDEQSKND